MGNENDRLALFNVTSLIDTNPGCKATILGLKKALKKEFVYQFPIGIGYEFFQTNKNSIFNKNSTFNKVYLKFKKNLDYLSFLGTVDYVIINAEGTIHDEAVGAKALLAFAKLAKELNKKVFIVNGSYYNLSDDLLKILVNADIIFVREKKSLIYLKQNNIISKLVPDCAFLTGFNRSHVHNNGCLYTPGVIFSYGKNSTDKNLKDILESQFNVINKKFDVATFLLIDKKEREFSEFWESLGGNVLDATSLEVDILLEKMSEFELVVSGRYHILLFALMCKLKTVPLSSNTDKIEGLYLTLGCESEDFIQDCLTVDLKIENPIELSVDLNEIRSDILSNYTQLFK